MAVHGHSKMANEKIINIKYCILNLQSAIKRVDRKLHGFTVLLAEIDTARKCKYKVIGTVAVTV